MGEYTLKSRRAEELIVEVYRQLLEARGRGVEPRKVVMSPACWASIEDYRRSLGVLNGPLPDYLSKNGLFGLEVWYGDESGIQVI